MDFVLKMMANEQEKMHGSAGFIMKRNEFEYEWNNECETSIADMEFNADDTMEDVQLKLKVLAIYNHRLDERERRKKFILEQVSHGRMLEIACLIACALLRIALDCKRAPCVCVCVCMVACDVLRATSVAPQVSL